MKFVIDTSVITNPYSIEGFANDPEQALHKLISILRSRKDVQVFLTTDTLKELSSFMELPEELYGAFYVKEANMCEVRIPGLFLYMYLQSMRDRINRGLRVAEKAVREFRDKPESEAIRYLRDNYRRVMREGIIDSKEDVSILLLALEQKAKLSTADEGIVDACKFLGIEVIPPRAFYKLLEGEHSP